MDATRRPVLGVGRAVNAHRSAIARLIRCLKHRAAAVRSEAADALKGIDPLFTWALGEALLGSRDTDFRLRIIQVLVALAAVDQVRVVCVLCEAFRQRGTWTSSGRSPRRCWYW
jgi:hypothetical protein